MNKILLLLFFISFYSCQTNVEDKKQKEIVDIEIVSDSIKTVDNDMINFLSIGSFRPKFLKTVADYIDIQYVDFDNHYWNLSHFDNNPFLIKILENYLDNNSIHPIEGIYDLIYNGEVGFKVFIYKSNYLDGFFVKVIENRNMSLHLDNLEQYKTETITEKVDGYPERKYKWYNREGLEYDYYWKMDIYPFGGDEQYTFGKNTLFPLFKDTNNAIFKNEMIKKLMDLYTLTGTEKGNLSFLNFPTIWEDYFNYLIEKINSSYSYAFIEKTSIENNYIIRWNTGHDFRTFPQSPPSIAKSFDNSLIKFVIKGTNSRENIVQNRGNTYEAAFLKTYPINGENSKLNNESNWAGNGSGLIISKEGHIVTNHHVIKDANSIEVEFNNEEGLKKYNAVVINSDKETDLAILKIEDEDFKEFNETPAYNFKSGLADSGEKIYAYGYPMALSTMGKEVKVTDGIISSKTGIDGDVKTYQISAPIQPGNSGGPLFDDKGNLLGINSSGLSKEIADNVGYSIKTNYLLNLIDVLPEKIELPYSYTIRWISNQNQIKRLSKYTVLIKVK